VTDVTAAWDDSKASNEHADWQRTDPILRTARTLIARGVLSREDVIAIDNEAAVTIAKARAFAEASPYPKPEAALVGAFV
jgi:TPP-dependent pyruvate/acetoin dehydrogenase alpha subunit